MRFKEKDTDKVNTNKVDNTSDDDIEMGGLKKLVIDLTDQVKSLKIQNEHMMDEEYQKKNKNKKRAKTINKIGALKLLLTNLQGELKDGDSESDLSSIKGQLDRVESKYLTHEQDEDQGDGQSYRLLKDLKGAVDDLHHRISSVQSQQIELSDIQRKMQKQYKTGDSNEKAIQKLYNDIEKTIGQKNGKTAD